MSPHSTKQDALKRIAFSREAKRLVRRIRFVSFQVVPFGGELVVPPLPAARINDALLVGEDLGHAVEVQVPLKGNFGVVVGSENFRFAA